eukprot:4970335-Pleurochrysis_carterae.AAC.7
MRERRATGSAAKNAMNTSAEDAGRSRGGREHRDALLGRSRPLPSTRETDTIAPTPRNDAAQILLHFPPQYGISTLTFIEETLTTLLAVNSL